MPKITAVGIMCSILLCCSTGEIDFEITFFEAVRGSYVYLFEPDIGIYYWGELAVGVVLAAFACFGTIKDAIKTAKTKNQQIFQTQKKLSLVEVTAFVILSTALLLRRRRTKARFR